jgi:WD40 repeat protein
MPRFRSCLGWTLSLLLLTGLAGFLYVLLPPAPRWRVEGQRLLTLQSEAFNPLASSRFQPLLPGRDVLLTCGGCEEDTGPVVLRDPRTGQVRRTLVAAENKIDCAELSPDGRRLALSLEKHDVVRLFDLHDGTEATTPSLAAVIEDLSFAVDGQTLAVRTIAGQVFLVAAATGQVLGETKVPQVRHSSWAFTSDGAYFLCPAFMTPDQPVGLKVWDMPQKRWAFSLEHTDTIENISSDGKTVVGLEALDKAKKQRVLWDLPSRKRHPLNFSTPDDRIAYHFSADGKTLALSPFPMLPGPQNRIEFRELPSQRRLSTISPDQRLTSIQMSPDGRYLAANADVDIAAGRLFVYASATGRLLWQRDVPDSLFGDAANPPAFSADGRHLFALTVDMRQLVLLDAGTGEVQASIPLRPWRGEPPESVSMSFSPKRDVCLLSAHWFGPPEQPPLLELLRSWILGDPQDEDLRHMYRVMDIAGRRELATATIPERAMTVRIAQLTADGHILVASEVMRGNAPATLQPRLEGWDLPQRTPWLWVLGPPLALGVLLLLARAGLRRWTLSRKGKPVAIEAPRETSGGPGR